MIIEVTLSIALAALVLASIALAISVWCLSRFNSTKEFVMLPANQAMGASEEEVISRALQGISPIEEFPQLTPREQEKLQEELENAWSVLDDDVEIVRS